MATKHTVLTFRMPTQIPLETQNKHAFDFWMRMHINVLIDRFNVYLIRGGTGEFIPFCEAVFSSNRALVEPTLN